jgi:adenylate cyclase
MNQEIKQFKDSFSNLFESTRASNLIAKSTIKMESVMDSVAFSEATLPTLQEEYAVQRPIRRWFGKSPEINEGAIGSHPNFIHLKGKEETEYHYMSTMFVDIQNSTRLALRYSLDDVRHIKNTILRVASETVRAMDGHVHRFMGDALMAYFGGRNQSKESSAMAAISCAAMLRILMQESVTPSLLKRGIDANDIGFRIGLDFGDDDEVLWSSYGYTDVTEVTATSFYVDASAKLQSMASKDNAMLGYNLIKFLEFPEALTLPKKEMQDGILREVPYLRPNYTIEDEKTLNYAIRELNFQTFARLLPLPTELKAIIAQDVVSRNGITFSAYVLNGASERRFYPSLSECLPKNKSVEFVLRAEPQALNGMRLPLKGMFTKQNHGSEAKNNQSCEPEVLNFTMQSSVDSYKNAKPCEQRFSRDTAYRGLHTVRAQLIDAKGQVVFDDTIGVHIK